MEPIRNFTQLTAHLKSLKQRKRIAVVCANDENTEYAINRALEEGIASFLMIGDVSILDKYPSLDMISFGPTLQGVHSPDERMLIPTVQKFWDHLLDILKHIPQK